MKKFIYFTVLGVILSIIIILFINVRVDSYSAKSMEIIKGLGDIKTYPGLYDNMTADEIDDVVDYIERYPEKVLPWHYARISDYIYRYKKDEVKAAQFYYRGLIRIQEDTRLCNDPQAKIFKGLIDREIEETTIIKMKLALQNPWNLYHMYMNELHWDESHKRYSNPYWVCNIMGSNPNNFVPLTDYDKVLKQYRKEMRNMDMWKELVEQTKQDIEDNKEEYESWVKDLK